MTSYPAVKGKDLLAALVGAGFAVSRIKGSHHFLRHPDGRVTVVPVHAGETIGHGLLARILRDTKISPINFRISCSPHVRRIELTANG